MTLLRRTHWPCGAHTVYTGLKVSGMSESSETIVGKGLVTWQAAVTCSGRQRPTQGLQYTQMKFRLVCGLLAASGFGICTTTTQQCSTQTNGSCMTQGALTGPAAYNKGLGDFFARA